MEWVIVFILIIGGVEVGKRGDLKGESTSVSESKVVATSDTAVLVKEAVFARGRYYRHQNGYFISDLSPRPVYVCTPEVLVADLKNRPSPDDQHLEVTTHKANCEG